MRCFIRWMSLMLTVFSLFTISAAQAEDDIFYMRVIAHSNTPYSQQQKIAVRDRVFYLLQTGYSSPSQLENALKKEGISVTVSIRTWQPESSYPPRPTLYITLGEGKGHNWWGILCADTQTWDFLQLHTKSDAPSDVAAKKLRFSLPFLEQLFSFLIFGQD